MNSDLTEEGLEKFLKWSDDLVRLKGRMRNLGIYVDLNKKEEKIITSKSINKEVLNDLLKEVNNHLLIVKEIILKTIESQKNKLRLIFRNIPKEAWKTGKIDIE